MTGSLASRLAHALQKFLPRKTAEFIRNQAHNQIDKDRPAGFRSSDLAKA
jgi:hypothetical protein